MSLKVNKIVTFKNLSALLIIIEQIWGIGVLSHYSRLVLFRGVFKTPSNICDKTSYLAKIVNY